MWGDPDGSQSNQTNPRHVRSPSSRAGRAVNRAPVNAPIRGGRRRVNYQCAICASRMCAGDMFARSGRLVAVLVPLSISHVTRRNRHRWPIPTSAPFPLLLLPYDATTRIDVCVACRREDTRQLGVARGCVTRLTHALALTARNYVRCARGERREERAAIVRISAVSRRGEIPRDQPFRCETDADTAAGRSGSQSD